MPLNNYLGYVFGYPEAGTARLSAEALIDVARKLNVLASLETLSKVGIALQNGGTHHTRFQEYLARAWFPDAMLARYLRFVTSDSRAVGFIHPGVIRKFIKLVWTYGATEGGETPFDESMREDITACILTLAASEGESEWINEHSRTDDAGLAAALLLSRAVYAPVRDDSRLLAAKDAMLSALITDPETLALYEAVCPVSPWQLVGSHLIATSYFLRGKPDYFTHIGDLRMNYPYTFGMAGFPRTAGDWFVAEYCAKIDDRPSPGANGPTQEWLLDARFLVERPYLCIQDQQLICLDYELAKAYLSRGLFKVMNIALRDQKNGLYARIGHPFEEFVMSQLRQADAQSSRNGCKVIGPLGPPSELDGAVQCGRIVVLFESKVGVISTSAKFGVDVEALKRELMEKFVEGRSAPKGFKQLAERVRTALDDPARYGLQKFDVVIPTIVVEDDFVAQRLVSEWCAQRARPMFAEFGKRVPFLLIVHVNDLEYIAALSNIISLPDALYRLGKSRYGGLFNAVQWIWHDLRQEGEVGDDLLLDIVSAHPFIDEAMAELRESFLIPVAPRCPKCNDHLTLTFSDQRGPAWVCGNCPSFAPRLASEEELRKHQEQVDLATERYWAR